MICRIAGGRGGVQWPFVRLETLGELPLIFLKLQPLLLQFFPSLVKFTLFGSNVLLLCFDQPIQLALLMVQRGLSVLELIPPGLKLLISLASFEHGMGVGRLFALIPAVYGHTTAPHGG
eukprot:scaffold319523_cov31-Tisochrysis_lutea.AAC.1